MTENKKNVIFEILDDFPHAYLWVDDDYHVLWQNNVAKDMLGHHEKLTYLFKDDYFLGAIHNLFHENINFDYKWRRPNFTHLLSFRSAYIKGFSHRFLMVQDLTRFYHLDKARANFIANASHELRTPLTSIVGYVETLQEVAKDDPESLDKFLPIIHDQAWRMTRLVEDLLSLSRIEMTESDIPSGQLEIKNLITAVIESLYPKAKTKNMPIKLSGDTANVIGSRDELTQVFVNLLDNAIKYGRENTPIQIKIIKTQDCRTANHSLYECTTSGCVMVELQDESDGIDPRHIPRLTERFYRVDKDRSKQMGGTGLGLAIVKHIVNRHRGQLEIQSELGVGSLFRVILPHA